jgi:hypothetical protein
MLTAPDHTSDMSPELGCSEKGECPATASEAPALSGLEPMDFLDFEAQMYFHRSGRSKVANTAVFYFKHSTTEVSSNSSDNDDEGWTYTPNNNAKGTNEVACLIHAGSNRGLMAMNFITSSNMNVHKSCSAMRQQTLSYM